MESGFVSCVCVREGERQEVRGKGEGGTPFPLSSSGLRDWKAGFRHPTEKKSSKEKTKQYFFLLTWKRGEGLLCKTCFSPGLEGDYGGAAISLPSSSDLDFFSSSPPPRQPPPPPPPAAKSTTNVEGGGRLTGEEEEGEGELRARGTLFLPYSLSPFPLLFFHFHGIGRKGGGEGRRAKGSDRRGGGRPPKCQEFRCRRGKEKLLLLLLSLHQVSSVSPWDYGERLLSLCLSPGREGGGSLGLCSRRESIGHWEKKRGKEEEAEAEPPLSRRGEEKGGGRGERERALCMPPSPFLSLSLSLPCTALLSSKTGARSWKWKERKRVRARP